MTEVERQEYNRLWSLVALVHTKPEFGGPKRDYSRFVWRNIKEIEVCGYNP